MPVHKFRSVDEMADLAWLPQGSPELSRAIRRTWRLAQALAPWRVPPGLYRFKTMAESNSQRDSWDRTCVHPVARPMAGD